MQPTKNDLSLESRKAVSELLNRQLANLIDLKLQAKQAHWNVKGPNFIALHELFDEASTEAEGFVDEVAERIVALGGTAEGTVEPVRKRSELPDYSLTATDGREHVDAVSTALATVGRSVRSGIDRAEELGDAVTADLLTGIAAAMDKRLWFVEAHLHGRS